MAATPTPKTTEQRLSLPLNGTIYTTTRDVNPRKPTPLIGATMAAELGAAWADSLIIGSSIVPKGTLEVQQITHARIPTEEAQLATNWQFSTCDIGGVQYPSVVRTVVLQSAAVTHDAPAQGSAMPFEAGSIFDGKGYILVDRQVMGSGLQLEPVFRVERRSYVMRSTITNLGVDSLNGKVLTSTSQLFYRGEIVTGGLTIEALMADPTNAYWGVQADGTQRTGQQLSCSWWTVTTETVVAGTFAGGVVEVDRYTTNDDYTWPPVLSSYALFPWVRRDGGTDFVPKLVYDKEGYSGPCLTTITRTWSKEKFTIPQVQQMLPSRINYSSPFFDLNIGECLHKTETITVISGSNHPVYKLASDTQIYPATNYIVWPPTIVAYDDQEPFRGGYLRVSRVVSQPS